MSTVYQVYVATSDTRIKRPIGKPLKDKKKANEKADRLADSDTESNYIYLVIEEEC